MRQVDNKIKSILNRKNLDMKFEAVLHDKEMKEPVVSKANNKKEQLSEDEKEIMDAALNLVISRKKKEWQAKTKK